jgi:hypothetical protein
MNKRKYYAGIGSRETPKDIMEMMSNISTHLSSKQYTLRSGGAPGADSAFDIGDISKEIFLPWDGFGNLWRDDISYFVPENIHEELVMKYHPAKYLKPSVMKLMSRNVNQILGLNLKSPVDFVVCWTKDGKASGGAGQAVRIANDYRIPVYNLKNKSDIEKFKEFLFMFE